MSKNIHVFLAKGYTLFQKGTTVKYFICIKYKIPGLDKKEFSQEYFCW